MTLVTLEDQTRPSLYLGTAPEKFADALRARFPMPVGAADTVVAVVVNHGRWIARCPLCRGAEHASREDHRFLCGSCGNREAGGQWLPVVWPADADMIEEVLVARPDRDTRNWETHETVDDLRAENTEHGVV